MADSNDDDNYGHKHKKKDDLYRQQKELMKALETPEQKRQRRLAKKEEKERRRKRLMGWDDEYMGYTNDDNPFGDSNLHETFVWKKKFEKMGIKRIDHQEITALNKDKMIKNRQELEKVKKRRLERERERELRQEEIAKQQRDKEAEQFKEWAKQEDYFHLKQARLRSKLRIKENRAKPVDLLAQYISVFGENKHLELNNDNNQVNEDDSKERQAYMKQQRDDEEDDLNDKIKYLQLKYISEPYKILNGLRIRDMEDLIEDIKIYLELDSNTKINEKYWKDLQIICDDELTKLKLANMDEHERRRENINPSVSADIAAILKNKTTEQLKSLQIQIEKKIAAREEGIDISFWESLLSRLKAQIARARLYEFHNDNMHKRKELIMKYEQNIKELQPSSTANDNDNAVVGDNNDDNNDDKDSNELDQPTIDDHTNPLNDEIEFLSKNELRQKCIQDYESGEYSPRKLSLNDINSDVVLMSAEDFISDIKEKRQETLKKMNAFPTPFVVFNQDDNKNKNKNDKLKMNYDHNDAKLTNAEESFVREARKNMNDDEAIFSVEQELVDEKELLSSTAANQQQKILIKEKLNWTEKYRPRKPRYFNRVHTGFEWNKYNQTHYDVDNPPPKVVQGYKFNIFYPDLIDKSLTPTYKLIPCKDNPEFAYIRFMAGPPYEDICFKIVNREWNYSYKSGFRCQFQNNILQLWFHFKRYRYRR